MRTAVTALVHQVPGQAVICSCRRAAKGTNSSARFGSGHFVSRRLGSRYFCNARHLAAQPADLPGVRAWASQSEAFHFTQPEDVTRPSGQQTSTAVKHHSKLPQTVKLLQELLAIIEGQTKRAGPQSINLQDITGEVDVEGHWHTRLRSAIERCQQLDARQTRIAILTSSARDADQLVLALTDDPLASDQTYFDQLRQRHASVKESLGITNIRYGENLRQSESTLALPLKWLAENNVEFVELITDCRAHITSATWDQLFAADVVLVLAKPGVANDLARLKQKPNVIYLSQTPVYVSKAFEAPVNSALATSVSMQTMLINLEDATEANDLLRSRGSASSGSPSTSGDFASLMLRSGVPQLRQHLEELSSPLEDSPISAAHRAILFVAAALLSSLADASAKAESAFRAASAEIGKLELKSARDKRHSQIELGFTDLGYVDLPALVLDTLATTKARETLSDHLPQPLGSGPGSAMLLEDGKRGFDLILDGKNSRIAWWKLPFGRADDVIPEIASTSAGYFADLERKLIFETGRLSERALALSAHVDSFFQPPNAFAPKPKDELSLHSAVVQNKLQALSPTTAFSFPPPSHPSPLNLRQTSLTAPIIERRQQLISAGGPIEKLQMRAQRAVVEFYGVAGGSTAVAAFLSQTPMPELAVSGSTALGIGLLGVLTAAWRLQGRWKKSKNEFWTNWARAQESLSYDLQSNADRVLEDKVFIKADTARKLLRKQINERKTSLEDLDRRLRALKQSLSNLAG